ncbi:DgyrCDS14544 [Dimorphilus gyrociliatus]|uniref:DgyrCDS14544 n=1 Tax=Dimorphilus gyrociliatus TaxID=2664684 RepID=A0A7I8WDY0_9ANNE|nr:DgyrCDS14544 [Dimorphilus gyrociliatus]
MGKDSISYEIMEQDFIIMEKLDMAIILGCDSLRKGGLNQNDTDNPSLECQIVQDADRLDAIGAIGIARTFAYGGHHNRLIYHPDIQPVQYTTVESYKRNNAPSINHFYEKLLLLKDRMNTKPGKDIAQDRHQYMLQFLQQFHDEWNGKK